MKIAIKPENTQKIEAALKAANGKANAHTITSYQEVVEAVERAENLLCQIHLDTKKAMIGAEYKHTPAGPSSKSYKYRATTTQICMKRGARDWFLTCAEKCEVFPKNPAQDDLLIDAVQARAAQLRFNRLLTKTARWQTPEGQSAHSAIELEEKASALL